MSVSQFARENVKSQLDNLATLVEVDPQRAAVVLDGMIAQLKIMADICRAQPPRSPLGMNDALRLEVVGPDGQTRQSVYTDR